MSIHKGLHPDSPFGGERILLTGRRAQPVPASLVDAVGSEGFRKAVAEGRLQDLVLARVYEQALKDLVEAGGDGDG